MCVVILPALLLAMAGQLFVTPLRAETVGRTVLPEPQASWFMMSGWEASYIFDAADQQMKGLISHRVFTPAVATLPSRKEACFVDSFYTRARRGAGSAQRR